jgi:putative transposase
LRKYLGEVLRDLARQKDSRVWEGHLMPDHVHMLVSIPPKYSVSQVGGKTGKTAIYIARNFGGRRRNFTGESYWSCGFFVSTCGRDDDEVRAYIRHQESEDKRLDQLKMFD